MARDYLFMHLLLNNSSIPCCNNKSWIQKITNSWVRIEIPIDAEIHMKTTSSLQRNEDTDNIFESPAVIKAKLHLKASVSGNIETTSIRIPSRVRLHSLKIIKNRQTYEEQESTAAKVLENLQHENMMFQQEIFALKNQIENMKLQQENLALKNQLNELGLLPKEAPLRPWSSC